MLFPCFWQDGTGPAYAATLGHLRFTKFEMGRFAPEINLSADLVTRMTIENPNHKVRGADLVLFYALDHDN